MTRVLSYLLTMQFASLFSQLRILVVVTPDMHSLRYGEKILLTHHHHHFICS